MVLKKSLWISLQIFRRFPVAPLIPYPLITKVRLKHTFGFYVCANCQIYAFLLFFNHYLKFCCQVGVFFLVDFVILVQNTESFFINVYKYLFLSVFLSLGGY